MTDKDWLQASDPRPMLAALERPARRKLLLFCCGCCRRVWQRMKSDRSRRAVESAEKLADRPWAHLFRHTFTDLLATFAYELSLADVAAGWTARVPSFFTGYGNWKHVAFMACEEAAQAASDTPDVPMRKAAYESERGQQASLLRDLFPFPPVRVERSVLTWNGGLIPRLAQAAYDERSLSSGELDHARLAVLADAVEEATSADASLLAHLRSPGPHVRGCHALDALLGKRP
jgi:hypothetical protein